MDLKESLMEISYCTTEERRKQIRRILARKRIFYRIERNENAVNLMVGDPKNALVTICAHYDIVPGSCGANDNGSSCAVLLHLCEERAGDPNVCFVFLDREESGFYGSTMHFSKYRPKLTINLDVIGSGEYIVYHNSVMAGQKGSYLNRWLDKEAGSVGFHKADQLPMCDTHNIVRLGHEVISFCAFPGKDGEYIRDTGHLSCGEVLKYMHNGCYDDIEHVCFTSMELVDMFLHNFLLSVSLESLTGVRAVSF
ncbi:MAG: M28 family peptidase [Lachnospiraceae bacterium]|nr:M28 family peptidase [Lachnospiraceae bacterium]